MAPAQAAAVSRAAKDELLALRNLGPALREDLRRLGVDSVAQLAEQDADELYVRLGRMDGRLHDPCVWDSLAAVIDIARGGPSQPWWAWTPIRKVRQAKGDFPSGI
ncbi:MAG TPA: helix-hairpin-helix domain-containing protein [Geothrix sp.]|nr:helix-hairpin-helix domain-containing protein [Geothrix sp.]